MAVLLGLLMVFRIIILTMPAVRPVLLHARNRIVSRDAVDAICRKTSLGDWWILYMLGRNLDPLVYREVIGELSKKIETAASNM